jgi:NAD-dependent dihydropyrimidine dehydrogenase PreA subunit
MSDKPKAMWHGIPRDEIPWYPTVDAKKCMGCGLCFVTCGRNVYEMQDAKSVAVRPYDCMVGCSTCATVCPVEAIGFPERDLIRRLEREYKILKIVREERQSKQEKLDAAKARAAAEDRVAQLATRVRVEVAGEFGEKRFLVQLEGLVRDRPYDITNLRLEVPTVQGALEKTPSFMSFEVVSTQQEDIQSFMPQVRDLVRESGLVWVSESKL